MRVFLFNFAKEQLKMVKVHRLVKVSESMIKVYNLYDRYSVSFPLQKSNCFPGGLARF